MKKAERTKREAVKKIIQWSMVWGLSKRDLQQLLEIVNSIQ